MNECCKPFPNDTVGSFWVSPQQCPVLTPPCTASYICYRNQAGAATVECSHLRFSWLVHEAMAKSFITGMIWGQGIHLIFFSHIKLSSFRGILFEPYQYWQLSRALGGCHPQAPPEKSDRPGRRRKLDRNYIEVPF